MTDDERVSRAQRYANVTPLLNEIFDGVRTALLEELAATSTSRPDDVLEMHRGLHNLEKLKQAVRSVVADGQIAAAASVARLNRF